MAGSAHYHGVEAVIPDFRAYYATATLAPVGGFKFRHIRLRTMAGRWLGLRRDISNAPMLRQLLAQWTEPPRDLYTTALRFLFPKEVHHLADRVPCLGGPLIFDLDATFKHILPSQVELERMKRHLSVLKDWLHEIYGYHNFSFVFSGHRGFHLYVNDFEVTHHGVWVHPCHREAQEKRIRTQIAYTALREGFPIDAAITTDTRRIIRIPNSLHGRTGLKTLLLPTERAVWNFHLTQAISFPEDPLPVRITQPVPIFHFGGQPYGAFRSGQRLTLPKAVAYLLILSHYALANTPASVNSRTEVNEDLYNQQLGEPARG